jgi:hypothetical protein
VAKNFGELRKKMSPESQERGRALAEKYLAEMQLDELAAKGNSEIDQSKNLSRSGDE